MGMIALSPDSILSTLQAHRAELQRSGIRHLSLFGSIARGEAGPDSDIDLLVELDREAHVTLIDLARIEMRLSEMVGHKVDVTTEPVKKERLRTNIERDRRRVF
jgi:uncharacterized protein